MKGSNDEIQGAVGMTNGRGCEMVGLLVDIGGCQGGVAGGSGQAAGGS